MYTRTKGAQGNDESIADHSLDAMQHRQRDNQYKGEIALKNFTLMKSKDMPRAHIIPITERSVGNVEVTHTS